MKNRITEPKPITSKNNFKEVDNRRKEINRLNRQRAKAMEKRVARYLDGTQTPQSGAGSAKGDILIDFTNRPGKYMIECKLSEVRKDNVPTMKLYKLWFDKMIKDAKSMRALFPVLVYHYHDVSGDFILVAKNDLNKLNIYPEQINEAEPVTHTHNTSAKTVVVSLTRSQLSNKPPYYSLLEVNNVVYYHMSLEYYRDLLKGI
jgi:hypothetical protein